MARKAVSLAPTVVSTKSAKTSTRATKLKRLAKGIPTKNSGRKKLTSKESRIVNEIVGTPFLTAAEYAERLDLYATEVNSVLNTTSAGIALVKEYKVCLPSRGKF